jgi:hypothetical protein
MDECKRVTLKLSDFGLSIGPQDAPLLLADRIGSLHYSANEFFTPSRWTTYWSTAQDHFALGVTIMSLMGCPAPSIEHYLDVPSKFLANPSTMLRRHHSIMRKLTRAPYSARAIEAVAGLLEAAPQDRSTLGMLKWARPL